MRRKLVQVSDEGGVADVLRWLTRAMVIAVLAVATTAVAACGSDDDDDGGGGGGTEAATQASGSGGTEGGSGEPISVGLVLPCPANDQSWCQQGHVAAQKLADEGLIDLKETESAPQDTAGASQVIAQYASGGSDLVIAHSAWQDAAMDAASKVPDANIAYAGGGETSENVATYEEPLYQASYLAGMAAGGITQTNVIGGLAGQDVPLCRQELEAFEAGAKHVNPKVTQKNTYAADWNDIAKGKEAALALADQDADVLIACGGGPATGMTQMLKERDVSGFGYVADQSSLAPQNLVGSVVYNLEPYFRAMVEDVQAGSFRPGKSYDMGVAEGGIQLVWNDDYSAGKIPPDVMKEIEKVQSEIESGEFEVPTSAGG